jgi:hypothetical protein
VRGFIAYKYIFGSFDQKLNRKMQNCRKNFWAIFCIFARIMPAKKSAAPPSVLLRFSEPPDPSAYNYMILDRLIIRQDKKTKN